MEIGEKVDFEKIGQRPFDTREVAVNLRRHAFVTVMSWGARAWKVYKDMFLRFMVSGHHHKGHVYIILGWDDTFTLYYTTSKGKIVDKREGVYVDELIDVIDKRVEYIEQYQNN